jgi:hypothetical protein
MVILKQVPFALSLEILFYAWRKIEGMKKK